MTYKYIFIFFISLFSLINLKAQIQQVKIIPITGTNGLSLGKINDIIQDKQGFIWLVDQPNQYVVRYDGSTMKRYVYDESNPNSSVSLGGGGLECIHVDNNGIIWIGRGGGVDRLNPLTDTITHLKHNPKDTASLTKGFVSCLLSDHQGILWIGTNNGLDRYDPKSKTITHFKHNPDDPSSLSNNTVRSIYEDRAGNLWIGTGFEYIRDGKGGLNKFERKSRTFTRYLYDSQDPTSIGNNKVRSIFEDSKGNFWIGTRIGLNRMNRKTGEFEKMAEKSDLPNRHIFQGSISSVVEDKNNTLWIGNIEGPLVSFNLNDNSTSSYPIFSTFKLFCSKDGTVWVSTENDFKLYQLNPHHNIIQSENEDIDALYYESSKVLWKGNSNGLVRVDRVSGEQTNFRYDANDQKSLSSDAVTCITQDFEGIVWIGTQNGLNRYQETGKNFKRYRFPFNTQEESWRNMINYIYEDSRLNFWICTGYGLGKYNRDKDDFTWMITDWTQYEEEAEVNSISVPQVLNIVEDSSKVLWIGTLKGGINRLDPTTSIFKHYLNGIIWQIFIDHAHIIWAATWNGLYYYDESSDLFLRHRIEEGISSIIEDSDHNLWVTGTRGMYQIFPNRDQFIFFGSENGISSENAMGASFRRESGEFIFTKRDGGYYKLDPRKLHVRKDTAQLYFTNLWIDNEQTDLHSRTFLTDPSSNTESLNLSYNENNFALSFTKLDFYARDKEEILYWLENYDQDWSIAFPGEKINYSKMAPGDYNFHIKSITNGNGIWAEKNMKITILPPWYKTWWAYGLYSFLLVSTLIGINRALIKRSREKALAKAKEKELAQAREIEKAYGILKTTQAQLIHSEKMASLGELTAGIAHEIKNPLNFVSNFSQLSHELLEEMQEELGAGNMEEVLAIASDVRLNLEKIILHGQRADNVVKEMLEHSRTGSGQKRPTDINALILQFLQISYHGFRAKNDRFDAILKTELDENIGEINVVQEDIGRVIMNLFNNAFYAVSEKKNKLVDKDYQPQVSVFSQKLGHQVIITVKDNGLGIPQKVLNKIFQPFFTTKPTGQGTGLGLSLSFDIIKAHEGKMDVKSEEGEGAEFQIALPV